MVIAENKKFVSCLIFPDFERAQSVKKEQGMEERSMDEFFESDYVKNELQDHINSINSHLDYWQKIVKFTVIHSPISIEGGEITPSMKIRRHVVEEEFSDRIAAMYQ